MTWAVRPIQNDFKEVLECGAAENIRQGNSNPSSSPAWPLINFVTLVKLLSVLTLNLLICKMGIIIPLTS